MYWHRWKNRLCTCDVLNLYVSFNGWYVYKLFAHTSQNTSLQTQKHKHTHMKREHTRERERAQTKKRARESDSKRRSATALERDSDCETVLERVSKCNRAKDQDAMIEKVTKRSWNASLRYIFFQMPLIPSAATYCNILQHTATYCNILQHTATYCNTTTI